MTSPRGVLAVPGAPGVLRHRQKFLTANAAGTLYREGGEVKRSNGRNKESLSFKYKKQRARNLHTGWKTHWLFTGCLLSSV